MRKKASRKKTTRQSHKENKVISAKNPVYFPKTKRVLLFEVSPMKNFKRNGSSSGD